MTTPVDAGAGTREAAPRVVLIAPWPPPVGGMAVQAQGLVRALRKRGIPVDVVPTNARLGPLSRVRGLRGLVNLAVFLARLVLAIPRADVLHVLSASGLSFFLFTGPVVVLGRLAGRRVVVNYRGGLARSFLERRGRFALPILRRCHRLVVPSGYLEAVFVAHGFRPVVIPNYVDLERHRFRSPKPRGQRMLVARSLEPMYDVDRAVEAFQRVRRRFPAAELLIAGTGSQHASLASRIRTEGIEGVTLLGRVANESMPGLLDEADLMLNPSRVDNMPISILEAFASGVPVVSTRAGGVVHLIEHGRNGLLADVGDARGLAACVIRMFRRPGRGAEMARAGRTVAESLDLKVVAASWEGVYREELAGLPARCAGP